jgi:Putative Flp pilus-assembly TadE/G-like
MKTRRHGSIKATFQVHSRRGNIIALSSAFIVVVLAFTAFAVDVGYIAVTRSQLQNAGDAAALAACLEMPPGLELDGGLGMATIANNSRNAALAVAALNAAGNKSSVALDSAQIEFGNRSWDGPSLSWKDQWGIGPYNMVRLVATRGTIGGMSGDSPLPLFFGPILGQGQANIGVRSKAALLQGVGFEGLPGNGNAPIAPIAYDVPSWNNNIVAAAGPDNWTYNPATGAVTPGPDGIPEIDLYPYGNQALTPGNRGTVDIGSSNNSTADLVEQLLNGVTPADLAYHGGDLRVDEGPIQLNGDTGLSVGIQNALIAIIGQARAIPLFTNVSGPGNNAMYTITQFAGIRILDVKLTGNNKYVIAQPAPVVSGTVIVAGDNNSLPAANIYSPPRLVQ